MRKSSSHLVGLDMLRGFAALSVMLFHLGGSAFSNQFGEASFGRMFSFGYAGLDLFFVLSGFIIFTVHVNDIGKPERLASYGWKRLTRIYPAYWVVTLIYIGLAYAAGAEPDIRRISHSLALIPDVQPFLAVAWTLSHEMLFYAVFALLIVAPTSGKLLAAAWFAGSLAFIGNDSPVWAFLFNVRHLEFLMGAAMAFAVRRNLVAWPLATLLTGLAMFIGTALLDLRQETLSGTGFILSYGLASTLVIGGTAGCELAGRLRVHALPRLLGAASYSIYLTHLLTFSILARILVKLQVPAMMPPGALLGVLAILMCGAGIIFHLLVEKPLLQLCRRAIPRHPATAPKVPHLLLSGLGLPSGKDVAGKQQG